MVTEVRSPVCKPGSKFGSGPPMSPGARSMPGARGDQGSLPEPSLKPQQDRHDRRGDEEEPREREQQEKRADSVLGLIKRRLLRKPLPQRPYVFKNFPTSSDR
jgi:hypothetical protein